MAWPSRHSRRLAGARAAAWRCGDVEDARPPASRSCRRDAFARRSDRAGTPKEREGWG